MINKYIYFFLLFLINATTTMATDVPGPGPITGTWTRAGSPYNITGNITVGNLTIEPGVEVIFNGNYQFRITGTLTAVGAINDTIYFYPAEFNPDGFEGLYFRSTAAPANIEYCKVRGTNTFGIKFENSQAVVRNSVITGITGNGIETMGCTLSIDRSSITGSSVNGIQLSPGSRAEVSNCRITDNGSYGISQNSAKVSLTNSLVVHNTVGGIALFSASDSLDFTNTTIAANSPGAGVTHIAGVTIIGMNSIIYDNRASVEGGSASVTISYSAIEGTYGGAGSSNYINVDPDFVDQIDFHLKGNSPMIDAGNPAAEYNDICFPPSQGGQHNDVGAYGGPIACYWLDEVIISPTEINFGTVTIGESGLDTLVIHNNRDSTLSIDNLNFSGPDSLYFLVSNLITSIAPFDSLAVQVYFTPDTLRNYQGLLELSVNGIAKKVSLSGSGTFPDISTSPSRLDFDETNVGDSMSLTLTVVNFAPGTLRISEIFSSNGSFFPENLDYPITIDPYLNKIISIVFSPDSNTSYHDSLFISSNDPDHPVFGVELTGSGKAPDISPSVYTLPFGRVMVDGSLSEMITFRNTGNDTLKISGFLIAGDTSVFKIDSLPVDSLVSPGETSDALWLSFGPDRAGSFTDTLIVISNSPFRDSLRIPLTGTGVQPKINVQDNVSFNEVIVSKTDSLSITIHNEGDTTLVIDSLKIDTGANLFSLIQMNDLTIPANDSSNALTVFYKPEDETTDQGELYIYSNDPVDSVKIISLSGRGVLPVLTIIPADTLDFDQVAINHSLIDSVLLKNSGSGTLIIDSLYFTGQDSYLFSLPNAPDSISISESNTEGVVVSVLFKPVSAGKKQALLQFHSNNPYQPLDSLILSGEGTVPVLSIDPDSIDFGQVYITERLDSLLVISNSGSGELIISAITISGVDSSLFNFTGISLPDTIPSDSMSLVAIRFEPDSTSEGNKTGMLTIASNDTALEVPMTGQAKSPVTIAIQPQQFSFDSLYVGEESAQSLVIKNPGVRDLIISDMSLSVNPEGSFYVNGYSRDLTILPEDSVSINVIFKPDSPGDKTDTLAIRSNDPLNPLQNIPVSGHANADTFAIGITFTTKPDTIDYAAGGEIAVHISKDGPPITEAIMHLRPGGAAVYGELPLAETQAGTWSAPIPAEFITTRGLEYYISAANTGTFVSDPDSGAQYPYTAVVTNISNAFPQPTQADQYQMISLPVNTGGQTMKDLFADDLGSYDNTKFRIYEWDPAEEKYSELSNMDQTLTPGKSVWLITKESRSLNITGGQSVSTSAPYSISLHAGWNMFGTPFAFEIDMAEIDRSALTGEIIYEYTSDGWKPWRDSVLVPYRGYAVKANTSSALIIPNHEATGALTKKTVNDQEWYLRLSATLGKIKDKWNYAGVKSTATNQADYFDYPEPPPIGDFVSLYFSCDGQRLTGDFRSNSEKGYIFDFTVQANLSGTTEIEAVPQNLPENFTWQIVSPQTGVSYGQDLLRTTSSSQEFKLIVGEQDFVEQIAAGYHNRPTTYELAQNFPNPFNPETKIRFALPAAGQINIGIYDITGRKVETIADNEHREAGYYEYTWQGLNDSGQKVASGIYFLYLRAPGYSKAIKMILQR